MKIILLTISLAIVVLSGKWFQPADNPYQTTYAQAVEAQTVAVEAPQFPRTFHENQASICINNSTHEHYVGELVTKAETVDVITKAGFVGEQIEIMAAISRAESGSDMRCVGDETLTGSKWDISYGLFQIRGLKNASGTCRDISLLVGDLQRQAVCAKEIWNGQGFNAWSVYQNGKYRQWLNQTW